MSDDRLKNLQPKDAKAPKTIDDRSSRDNALDDKEIEDLLRGENIGAILPTPPHKAGYHRIWLSETNQQNPISRYERFGYRKVHPNDVPGFGQEYLKSPSGVEEVRCNEMLLYEVPDSVYYKIMKVYHHDMPLELQGKPNDDVKAKFLDPKTGESLYREESDEYAREESRRRVPNPKFE